TVKAYFVLAYFMHLKWDSVMNRVLIGSSFFFLALLAIFVFLDEMTRINPRM
ncbi:MAG: cytochrome C oxidase subunit IV family protein, partial [Bdellovibrionota bacterium]|nr:cytochrome C oxidase subunit IV family protein [Bdellovibrionota bacterium]